MVSETLIEASTDDRKAFGVVEIQSLSSLGNAQQRFVMESGKKYEVSLTGEALVGLSKLYSR